MAQRKQRSDNSDVHNYLKPSFWLRESSHFWNAPIYTDAAREYFEKFVEAQRAISERKYK